MKRIHVIVLVVAVALVALPALAQYGITNFSGVHLDGSFTTATPVLLVAPATSQAGNVVEFRNAQSTPVFKISSSGSLSHATFPDLSAPYKITVPTAQTTATPGLQIDSLAADGDSVMISKAAGTRVAYIDKDGNGTFVGVTAGGNITLQNGEVIDNGTDGSVKITDGTNTLMTIADAGTTGNLTVTGTAGVTGHTTLTGGATLPLNATSGVGMPLVVSTSFTYTAAAGATYNAFIIPENQKLIIHSVLCNVTTNFDATGDDATLTVGDANDGDGFLTLADAELQAADTEGTGFAAGWQGMADATIGVYLDEVDSGFVVVAPAGGYTVTYTLDETSGDTLAGGAATLYMIYTRIL